MPGTTGMGHGDSLTDSRAFRDFAGHDLIEGGADTLHLLLVEQKMRQFLERVGFVGSIQFWMMQDFVMYFVRIIGPKTSLVRARERSLPRHRSL